MNRSELKWSKWSRKSRGKCCFRAQLWLVLEQLASGELWLNTYCSGRSKHPTLAIHPIITRTIAFSRWSSGQSIAPVVSTRWLDDLCSPLRLDPFGSVRFRPDKPGRWWTAPNRWSPRANSRVAWAPTLFEQAYSAKLAQILIQNGHHYYYSFASITQTRDAAIFTSLTSIFFSYSLIHLNVLFQCPSHSQVLPKSNISISSV